MTGEEFVNTWNDLFRLRDNDQCPDKCLEKADFIESVSESISGNASRLLQGQKPSGMVAPQTMVRQAPAQTMVMQPPNQYVNP